MNRRIYTVLLLLLSGQLMAQDLKQALVKMRTLYEQSDKFHIVMRIQAFEHDQVATPYYDEKAEVMRSGDNYISRFGGNDMLMNETYFLMVDKRAHEIVCSPRNLKAERDTFKDLVKMSLDSILSLYHEPRYLGRNNKTDQYEIIQKRGPINLIGLSINSETNILSEMKYHYRDKQVVAITFEIFDVRPVFATGTFDEAQYIAKAKGKTMPAPAFRKYTITDAAAK